MWSTAPLPPPSPPTNTLSGEGGDRCGPLPPPPPLRTPCQVKEVTDEVRDGLQGCSIYLVGMMGSGKSTLGTMLSNTLRYSFLDTDTLVELAHDKKPVAQIFAEYGADYFRDAESEVCVGGGRW